MTEYLLSEGQVCIKEWFDCSNILPIAHENACLTQYVKCIVSLYDAWKQKYINRALVNKNKWKLERKTTFWHEDFTV